MSREELLKALQAKRDGYAKQAEGAVYALGMAAWQRAKDGKEFSEQNLWNEIAQVRKYVELRDKIAAAIAEIEAIKEPDVAA